MGVQPCLQRQDSVSLFFIKATHLSLGLLYFSCKHLCCREGSDKAPKPPKNAFVSASALIDQSSLSVKDLVKRAAVKKTQSRLKPTRIDPSTGIESLDLSNDSRSDEVSAKAPHGYRKFERLNNIANGIPTPRVPRYEQAVDIGNVGHLQASILDKTDAKDLSNRPSTDYSDDWMSDLPSPSALLGKQQDRSKSNTGGVLAEQRRERMTHPGSLPHLSHRENLANDGVVDPQSLEDVHSYCSDDEGSDLEAAMIGLSDSFTMHGGLQIEEEDIFVDSHPYSTLGGGTSRKANGSDTVLDPSGRRAADPFLAAPDDLSEKLLLSTDDVDKAIPVPSKRAASESAEENISLAAPVSKRAKTGENEVLALQAPSSAETGGREDKEGKAVIKPGLPGWVYEFDPAFIAEWQDIVDFV